MVQQRARRAGAVLPAHPFCAAPGIKYPTVRVWPTIHTLWCAVARSFVGWLIGPLVGWLVDAVSALVWVRVEPAIKHKKKHKYWEFSPSRRLSLRWLDGWMVGLCGLCAAARPTPLS